MSSLQFKTLCNYFRRLEETTKRNEMISILAELFQETDEVDSISYFLVGDITAGYKDIQLGMGEEMTKSSISLAFNLEEAEIDRRLQDLGDLGNLVAEVNYEPEKKFSEYFKIEELNIKKVHEGLMKIATTSGEKSQEIMKKTSPPCYLLPTHTLENI